MGQAGLVLFTGIMDTHFFLDILREGLLPFLQRYPECKLMQDNGKDRLVFFGMYIILKISYCKTLI